MKQEAVSIMWFRRDLRLEDNAALYHALKHGKRVVPLFIFDSNILSDLENKQDRRIEFIYQSVCSMQQQLQGLGSTLEVHYGTPDDCFRKLLQAYDIKAVFANEDYERYALDRDNGIARILSEQKAELKLYKDQVVFSKDEIVKQNGTPYSVFTPYSKVWLAKLTDFYLASYPTEKYFPHFLKQAPLPIPPLSSLGFEATGEPFPSKEIDETLLADYDKRRDYPALEGTSRLGIHLRFGTVSIRNLVRKARKLNSVFIKELIWRDFYQMILWHSERVRKEQAFKAGFDRIEWRNNESEFTLWCEGKTGYPIVDAGMRQLNQTGYMHNRVRMITASFLTKHLLIDWRWGEAYFAKQLLDFDYAANNGGWQWCAGSGADPSPYFRVFNPSSQLKKFDKNLAYVKQWVPEYGSEVYTPMVEHSFARKRALTAYKKALRK